jgi:DnaJ-class molecular chaperone
MSHALSRVTKAIQMDFGKRVWARDAGPAAVVQQTCVRCCGTGWVRERGSKITCKPCKGSGRVTAKTDRDT